MSGECDDCGLHAVECACGARATKPPMTGGGTKIVADSERPKPPAAGNGRPKGALNKTTRAAKEAIALAAEALGGMERIAEWAKEDAKNESAFWTQIYTKLIPLQHGGDPDNPLVHEIRRSFHEPRAQ